MSNEENEEFFRNLSRKELQSLCKQCSLPARKSSSEMAGSLLAYFQNNGLGLRPSSKSLKGSHEALPAKSPAPMFRPQSPFTSTENAIKDSVGLRFCTVEDGNIGKGNINFDEGAQFQFASPCIGRGVHKETHVVSGSGLDTVSQCPCRGLNSGAYSKENASSMNISARVPAFEFHVSSEEGIKLCVDLSSSPADWIKKYKDQVCLSENLSISKSRSLHQELGRIGENNKQINGSVPCSMDPVQPIDGHAQVEHSLSSAMGEKLLTEIGQLDGGDISIKQCSEAGNVLGCPEKDQVLGPNAPNSDVHNPTTLNAKSCSKNRHSATLDSDISSTPVEKTACNFGVSSLSDSSIDLVALDNQHSKPDDEVCEISTLQDSYNHENTSVALDHQNSKADDEVCENSMLQNSCNIENVNIALTECLTSRSVEMQLSEAGTYLKETSYSPQKNGPSLAFVDSMHKVRKQGALTNSSEVDTLGNQLPSCFEEQECSNIANQRESSVCSEVDNSFEKTSSKPYSMESNKEFHRKRLHKDSEGQDDCSKCDGKFSKSMKHSAGEMIPRRSMRLVLK